MKPIAGQDETRLYILLEQTERRYEEKELANVAFSESAASL